MTGPPALSPHARPSPCAGRRERHRRPRIVLWGRSRCAATWGTIERRVHARASRGHAAFCPRCPRAVLRARGRDLPPAQAGGTVRGRGAAAPSGAHGSSARRLRGGGLGPRPRRRARVHRGAKRATRHSGPSGSRRAPSTRFRTVAAVPVRRQLPARPEAETWRSPSLKVQSRRARGDSGIALTACLGVAASTQPSTWESRPPPRFPGFTTFSSTAWSLAGVGFRRESPHPRGEADDATADKGGASSPTVCPLASHST